MCPRSPGTWPSSSSWPASSTSCGPSSSSTPTGYVRVPCPPHRCDPPGKPFPALQSPRGDVSGGPASPPDIGGWWEGGQPPGCARTGAAGRLRGDLSHLDFRALPLPASGFPLKMCPAASRFTFPAIPLLIKTNKMKSPPQETRLKEGIVKLKPHEEPLRSELLSGKFTILSVALFYLLDRAVESFETQRNGLVFIYDMAGSQYTNFELDLSKKILNLLKGAFPARLKKVFIVGAPMWFRVPYSIISLLLKEKLRERVQMVKMSELKEHLPRECLPETLGGCLKLDPLSWNCRFLPQQNGHPDPLDELILVPLVAPKDNGSVHVPGPRSVTLPELLEHVGRKQKRGIYEEYEEIRRRSPAGTFACSLAPYNQEKNRYGDVPCLDQTRVKLAKPYSRPELTDYINASFMDGYKQRNTYIGTQGPLENTYGDFWRMVWEQNVLVIVMTTRLEEGGRRKCGQYWPLEKDSHMSFGALTVTNLGVENLGHYKKTILEIHSSEGKERRLLSHFQYLSWPDYGVPSSAATLIDFLGAVKQQQRVAVSALGPRFKGHPGGPPLVVHCSAGIGRTGTFCALDICLSQLQDVGTLDIQQTVLRMRTQRAFSIQTPEQYYFCYTAVLEHARRQGLLPEKGSPAR
uniref:protein-tyrosine-phosphatase n=1 Tax=Cairina moschata TaxID=8855 RepID=A0A8C3CIC0_CAIMO